MSRTGPLEAERLSPYLAFLFVLLSTATLFDAALAPAVGPGTAAAARPAEAALRG